MDQNLRTPAAASAAPQSSGRLPVSVRRLRAPPSRRPSCTSPSRPWAPCRPTPGLRTAVRPTTARSRPCTGSFSWAPAPRSGSPEGSTRRSREGRERRRSVRCLYGKIWWSSGCWLLKKRQKRPDSWCRLTRWTSVCMMQHEYDDPHPSRKWRPQWLRGRSRRRRLSPPGSEDREEQRRSTKSTKCEISQLSSDVRLETETSRVLIPDLSDPGRSLISVTWENVCFVDQISFNLQI